MNTDINPSIHSLSNVAWSVISPETASIALSSLSNKTARNNTSGYLVLSSREAAWNDESTSKAAILATPGNHNPHVENYEFIIGKVKSSMYLAEQEVTIMLDLSRGEILRV